MINGREELERISLKRVTDYTEFTEKKNAPSLLDFVFEMNQEEKSKVLKYMRSFPEDVVCPCRVYDLVKGIHTKNTLVYYTDGQYVWDEREIYHFEKYNIKLCDEFVSKILGGMK